MFSPNWNVIKQIVPLPILRAQQNIGFSLTTRTCMYALASSVSDYLNFSQFTVPSTFRDIQGEFLIQEHIFGESRPNNGPHRVAPFV